MRRVARVALDVGKAVVEELDTVAFLGGAALIVKGVSTYDAGAAYIVAGVLLAGVAYMAARGRSV